jgi:chromosome segregation ATPase
MQHEVEKKKLENKVKRENEAEENKIKLSKNSFNDNFATLVENIRVNELEKTVKKQKLDIEKKTKENADLKDSSDGLNNQITIWEESNKNLQDEMSLQKSIFEKKSNEVTDLNATINELKNKVSVMKKSSMISQDNINHEKMKLEEKYQKLEENYEAKCRQVEKLQSENRCQISDLEVQKTKIQEYEYFQKRHSTDLKKHTKDHQIKINIWKETGEKEKKDWEVKYESYVQIMFFLPKSYFF